MSKERPILFSGPMVRAILSGAKTQTRRVIKPQPPIGTDYFHLGYSGPVLKPSWTPYRWTHDLERPHRMGEPVKCPYGREGDKLWVKETCRAEELEYGLDGVRYIADGTFIGIENTKLAAERWGDLYSYGKGRGKTVPSIFMPKWASRLQLRVKDVRVERVQDISNEDAWCEGVSDSWEYDCVRIFRDAWNSIYGKSGYGWDANPHVWVVEFERISQSSQ